MAGRGDSRDDDDRAPREDVPLIPRAPRMPTLDDSAFEPSDFEGRPSIPSGYSLRPPSSAAASPPSTREPVRRTAAILPPEADADVGEHGDHGEPEEPLPLLSMRPPSTGRARTEVEPEAPTSLADPPLSAGEPVSSGYSVRPPPASPKAAPPPTAKGDASRQPPSLHPASEPKRQHSSVAAERNVRRSSRPASIPPHHGKAGRVVAFILCVLFAIIGAVPVFGAALVRTRFVQTWAARETARILETELGTRATYEVNVKPWPLTVTVENLVIEGEDDTPFMTVERASVRPRLFSLLAGKLDVGDVDVTGVKGRAVVRNGELVNFKPKTPETKEPSKGPTKAPFHSVAVTDADLDLDVDGNIVSLREVDVDVVVERDGSFEVGLRAGAGAVSRTYPDPRHPDEDLLDEDRLCRLNARAHFDPNTKDLLVRRLALDAVVDFDPRAGTRPSCDLSERDWRRVSVRLSAFEVPGRVFEGDGKGLELLSGRLAVSAPAALAHRFVKLPQVSGAIDLNVELFRAPFEKTPLVAGRLHGEYLGLDAKVFCDRLDGDVRVDAEGVTLSGLDVRWADGDFHIKQANIDFYDPKIPLDARGIVADNVELQGLLRDLGVHPQSHVGWHIVHTDVASFGGTLNPLNISGKLVSKTRDFGIYDRPSHKPDKERMMSLSGGDVTGVLAIRQDAAYFEGMHVLTPGSDITASIKLGFDDAFGLDVAAGSRVDLAEISPLVSVDIGGKATVQAHGTGDFERPHVEGELKVDAFELGGFKAGDLRQAHVVFEPLWLELSQVELWKNTSFIQSNKLRVAFDAGPDVLVDADLSTVQAPHLKIRDFFEVFQFDKDPRYADIAGTAIGNATVHYVIGGTEDRCGGGVIDVSANMNIDHPEILGETFDRGAMDFDFLWDDRDAGGEGMVIDVSSASFEDGTGSVVTQLHVAHGGAVRGSVLVAGMPLSRLEAFGSLRPYLDGDMSMVGSVGGTLSRLEADLDVSVTPLRFGANKLPASRLAIQLERDPTPPAQVGTSRCQLPISPPFSEEEWKKDLPNGQFRVNGQLFGGQITLSDVTISRQSAKLVEGKIDLNALDLGKIAAGLPMYALGEQAPGALITASIDVSHLEMENLAATNATIRLASLEASSGDRSVKVMKEPEPIRVSRGDITIPVVELEARDQRGLRVGFTAEGEISKVFSGSPQLDASLAIAPFDISRLRGDLGVDRLAGTLNAAIDLDGDLTAPSVNGYAKLRDGTLAISSEYPTLEDIALDVSLGDGELRVTRLTANVGAGTLDVTGRIPIVGLGLGTGTASITARGIKVPVEDGIDVIADADLSLLLPASSRERVIPELSGTVSLSSFTYRRPIALRLDLGQISRDIGISDAQALDPEGDFVRFNLKIVAPNALVVENDLADIRLEMEESGLDVSGTNQRYGARGALRVLPESKLRLRNHEFDVREGFVRFDDPTRVRAEIDVRATTELRRYASSDSAEGATTAGFWTVNVRAYGSTDDLKLELTSDPPLDQEDIVLLLAVGMTRAEVDRGLATSLGETVGLEALSALTGADKAVKTIVPIIDYFHFGSSYSSRTGRTEPNVTVGKRLTDDIRASVTTTLTQRDVAATIEWRLKKGVSLQASYDNTNDAGTIIGNLGADLRWRLEFE
ncbi:MAG: translocation/assembly module TamB domain-containing protein [Polyangiaceae bacterium]